MEIERNGYVYYEHAAEKPFLSKAAKELLLFLKEQEIEHEKLFASLRDGEDEIELESSVDWDTVSRYLKAIIDYRLFNSPKTAVSTVEQTNDEAQLIDNAISFEKDTLLYYQSIRDVIKNDHPKELLDKIIKEELSHILKLTLYKEKH